MDGPKISTDTIAAISTPPGRGGIGIVRLSGPEAASIAAQLVRLRQPLEHARARLADVLDGAGNDANQIDEAVVTWFAAPNSYTAEDVVEIAAHGSPVVLELLLRRALELGARLAEPGEFTQRAFLAGRLDLTQAEAVRDLIEAQTLTQARQAASQMGGALSRRVGPVKQSLVELIALLEAGIDFAEDDVEVTPEAEIARRIGELTPPLTALEASFSRGRIVHDGLTPGHCGPAQRRQELALQPAGGARTGHRDGHARHHSRPGDGADFSGRHSAGAGGYGRAARGPARKRSSWALPAAARRWLTPRWCWWCWTPRSR